MSGRDNNNNNKASRHQAKMRKYKKRINTLCIKESPTSNLYAFRSHGQPCSCDFCNDSKRINEKTERQRAKKIIKEQLQG